MVFSCWSPSWLMVSFFIIHRPDRYIMMILLEIVSLFMILSWDNLTEALQYQVLVCFTTSKIFGVSKIEFYKPLINFTCLSLSSNLCNIFENNPWVSMCVKWKRQSEIARCVPPPWKFYIVQLERYGSDKTCKFKATEPMSKYERSIMYSLRDKSPDKIYKS